MEFIFFQDAGDDRKYKKIKSLKHLVEIINKEIKKNNYNVDGVVFKPLVDLSINVDGRNHDYSVYEVFISVSVKKKYTEVLGVVYINEMAGYLREKRK